MFAEHHGAAEVVVADPTPQRRAAAKALGLTAADPQAADLAVELKSRWRHGPGDRGADVVFQCRGQSSGPAPALRLLRPQGAVIDLAFYPDGAPDVRLGEEFHHNGLTVRCARIGRVPRGTAHAWDRERLSAETVDLLLAEQVDRHPAPRHRPRAVRGRSRPARRPRRAPDARAPGRAHVLSR
ncbi:zinc-binding dehydrogenase [Saccharothrix isguenensis]